MRYKLPEVIASENNGNGDEAVANRKTESRLPPIDRTGHRLPDIWGNNPFKIPENIHWIDLCQEEVQREIDMRRTERDARAHLKHTFRSRYSGTTLPAVREMFRRMEAEEALSQKKKLKELKEEVSMATQKCRVRPVGKEFTHELVQRKREMFLVNFGIKTKRDEISGFKERAIMEEHKMRKRAQRLHEDAVLFDEFLKATDEAAVEAMKRTEKETKTKIEKTAELRRMQVKLNAAKGDISKTDETLSDYLRYKSFLLQVKDNLEAKDGDLLTSDEWLEKRVKERKLEKERKKRKKKPESQAKQRAQRIAPYINRKRNTTPRTVTRTSSKLSFSKVDFPEEWDTTSPQSENDNLPTETKSIHHIMKDHKHLLEIIKDLEEENLKMIYHFQHSEEALEETKDASRETKAKLVKEVLVLKKQVLRMENMIADAQERSKELKLMCQILDEGTHENGDQALVDLNEKVEKVYYNVVGKLMLNIDGLMMLTNIENKMELLLDEIESLPEAAVKEIQKIKDKERRLQLREDKLAIQRHRQEDRARKAQERANANSFKRVGRRLVFRSEPIKGRVAKASNDAIVTTDSSLFLAQH